MEILPKVAIVGRPNVGKSTLFNRLIGRKQAIVDDIPGVTRDRQYGTCDWGGVYFEVIDTGGFHQDAAGESLEKAVRDQALLAIEECAVVVFVLDGRSGVTPAEQSLAKALRRQTKPVILAINKIDQVAQESMLGEFYSLGFKDMYGVSAETSRGISDLLDAVVTRFPEKSEFAPAESDLKIAIVGRPNVGKSTLLNALIGEERAVVHATSGTTRDPLNIKIERGSRNVEFVDTAGIRRRAQSEGKLEKVSVMKAFKSLEKAHLALVLIDAEEGMTTQDARVVQYAWERGRGVILVLNKWDLVPTGTKMKEYRESVLRRYKRFEFIPFLAISAKYRRGVKNLWELIDKVHENFLRRVGTGELNRVFQKAVDGQPPPLVSGMPVRLLYATQSGWGPPAFVIFCNRPKLVKENYLRYLENVFRKSFDFSGSPMRWLLRAKKK